MGKEILKHGLKIFEKLKLSRKVCKLNGLEILNCYVHVAFLSNLITIRSSMHPSYRDKATLRSQIVKPGP